MFKITHFQRRNLLKGGEGGGARGALTRLELYFAPFRTKLTIAKKEGGGAMGRILQSGCGKLDSKYRGGNSAWGREEAKPQDQKDLSNMGVPKG